MFIPTWWYADLASINQPNLENVRYNAKGNVLLEQSVRMGSGTNLVYNQLPPLPYKAFVFSNEITKGIGSDPKTEMVYYLNDQLFCPRMRSPQK